jgi:hypothetical protein
MISHANTITFIHKCVSLKEVQVLKLNILLWAICGALNEGMQKKFSLKMNLCLMS